MRSVRVEMLHILAQHEVEMTCSGDQEVIEAFSAQGADEAFRDCVRPGCANRGADGADVGAGEHRVEGRGEFAVSVADQEPKPVGAENPVTSCDLDVFVDEAAEPVSS